MHTTLRRLRLFLLVLAIALIAHTWMLVSDHCEHGGTTHMAGALAVLVPGGHGHGGEPASPAMTGGPGPRTCLAAQVSCLAVLLGALALWAGRRRTATAPTGARARPRTSGRLPVPTSRSPVELCISRT